MCGSSSQAASHDGGDRFLRAARKGKRNRMSVFQVSACITFAMEMLSGVKEVTRPNANSPGREIDSIFERRSNKVTLQSGSCASMGKICNYFYNISQCPIVFTLYYFINSLIHLFTHSCKNNY